MSQNLDVKKSDGVEAGSAIRQFLIFQLANEYYGIDILRVNTIQCLDRPTPLPDTPSYLLGVVNLRGEIVPVIDLRRRFGLESVAENGNTVVVIVRTEGEQERTVGMVADAVCDVSDMNVADIRPAPDVGDVDSVYLKGLVNNGERMVVILDLDRLVADVILDRTAA